MPRLDNTNPEVIEYYDLPYDEDDPGDTPLVDLCEMCFIEWIDLPLEIDHPGYEDWQDYYCLNCGKRLTIEDD